MTANIHEPSALRQLRKTTFQGKNTHQKPLAFRWWEPDCITGVDGCTGDEPSLENGFAQPGPSDGLELFAFRLHADGSLEFKGHLDVDGASSGDVAVTLPGANSGEVDFRPASDQYWHTTVVEGGGTSFTLALVFIEASTGEVTLTWPAS